MLTKKIFISGATGFIGSAVIDKLQTIGFPCIGIARRPIDNQLIYSCDIFDKILLKELLKGVECVVHCAGFAHAFKSTIQEVKKQTWRINFEGTKSLLEAASEAGVKKFIFLSSVKAMSDSEELCADEYWPCEPTTEYGRSKLAAEEIVNYFGQSKSLDVVILRLSMVYGGGNGNVERMMRLVKAGIFPPLPNTNNHRSMIYISDVVDAIVTAIVSNNIVGETFIVTGPDSPSGRQLYDSIRVAYSIRPTNFFLPASILRFVAYLCDFLQRRYSIQLQFNSETLGRLLNSAWYSSHKLQAMTNWSPKINLISGLSILASTIKSKCK